LHYRFDDKAIALHLLTHLSSDKNVPESTLRLSDIQVETLAQLLGRYQMILEIVSDEDIPGSYWGDTEAGLIANKLYARPDTPIHSILHEVCHYICMDQQRRSKLDTNAEGDYDEENGVCYLQILLADELPDMGRDRMMQDMDAWGYTFRLGSSKAWFEQDAEDALNWLKNYQLVAQKLQPTFRLRE
jgi:hypothetical protein